VGSASVSRNWTHDKFNPLRIAHPEAQLLQEDLHAGTLITLVNTPIGLHSIMTCLDLTQAAVISAVRLEFLPQQFLWSPSTSESVSAHRDHAKTIHLNHATIIACAIRPKRTSGTTLQSATLRWEALFTAPRAIKRRCRLNSHNFSW
jgi:hypothetical protein